MRKIALTTAAILFATAGIVSAQTQTQPVPQKDSPKVEAQEKMNQKGNEENQNPNATKGKEQAPKASPSR